MSDSVRPRRQQPTGLCHPWASPGKNTGVGCHFLLHCVKVKSESEVAQSCPTLQWPHGLQPTRLLHPWDFLGKSTGVACNCLLQIFPAPHIKPLSPVLGLNSAPIVHNLKYDFFWFLIISSWFQYYFLTWDLMFQLFR